MQQFTSSGELAVNMNLPGYMAQQHPQQAQPTAQSGNSMAMIQQLQQSQQAQMQMMQQMMLTSMTANNSSQVVASPVSAMANQFSTSGSLGTQQFGRVERSSY